VNGDAAVIDPIGGGSRRIRNAAESDGIEGRQSDQAKGDFACCQGR
jgi:hypothetical protein